MTSIEGTSIEGTSIEGTSIEGTDDGVHRTYRAAGFTGCFKPGQRPAILVVDFCRGFTDPACPLGSEASVEVDRTRRILDAARRSGVLVVFTTIAYDAAGLRTTAWLHKVPSLRELAVGSPWVEIDPRLGRRPEEPVLVKPGPSAFFGTPLAAQLVAAHIDSVVIMGATTSGCVRGSVVDAVQYGFPTFVVPDCCVDRAPGPHEANLFDMTAKYADPLMAEEVVGYLERLGETVAI
jgi:maleamate amidohydrolase